MATIVMVSEKVIEAADKQIASIREVRLQEDEANISQYIRRSIPGKFFAKLGFKAPTREQAIEKLSKDIWNFFPSVKYWATLEKCKKLRKLAQHGDPVTLNEEDILALF